VKNPAQMILNNLPKMKKTFEAMSKQEALAGVPGDTTGRKEVGANNASLAYIHDKGSPANNIPARPFMKPGVEVVKPRIIKVLAFAVKGALGKDDQAIEKGLNKAGLIAQNSIRATINAGVPPPLKEGTLAGRRRRGRTGTAPLIDTGQLRNSITYVLRKK
jgi:hypothetical protein